MLYDDLMKTTLPYGNWRSPISAKALTAGAASIEDARPGTDATYWSESRPDEGGRSVIMRARGGHSAEITPAGANVRSTVHEYGGGSWQIHNDTVYYVEYKDQRVRAIDPQGNVTVLTPVPEVERGLRFADFVVSDDGNWVIAVCERHSQAQSEPNNSLVAIATNGSLTLVTLTQGHDFYACPRLSPEGTRLAWIQWMHPNMPWDTTELCCASLSVSTQSVKLEQIELVAGGDNESVIQPEFAPDGTLHYLSDRADFWYVYRQGEQQPRLTVDGEIGVPHWVFGQSRYAFLPDGSIVFANTAGGIDYMDKYPDYSAFRSIRTCGDSVCVIASSWNQEAVVLRDGQHVTTPRDLQSSLQIAPAYLCAAESLQFDTSDGEQAYALYFAPTNPQFNAPDGDKPPLIVLAHGGPTSSARSELHLARQFWTSRGFAVADVNYRGSAGFGRAYRQKLNGQWGIADVQDCVNAARHLVERGDVDPDRLIIRGGSAGGYTVLSALAFHDVFATGANLYGVADLEALAQDTHKFESRYLDNLVGPYPEAKAHYQARSPINHLSGFTAPMIVLQGSEDKIVPPSQSRRIVEALKEKNVPVAYLEFAGEQHGFRQAETIIKALNAELGFYGRVLGFNPDNEHVDLEISGLG